MIAPHDFDHDKVDLSALDPDRDGNAAAERFVAVVMSGVHGRPRPKPMPADPLLAIWSTLRSPALAAGIVILMALGSYALRQRESGRPRNIAQAMGVPAEFMADAGLDLSLPERR